jgi:2-iminobutanoate/2-iminopropanoate deaminase
MAREVIHSDKAPKAIGPYSQAIRVDAGRMIFCSGQVPLVAETMEFNSQDVAQQTEQVMKNLEAVLAAAGAKFEHVVRTTIFLTNLGDFGTVNEVYGRYFPTNPPARATVQVAALPRGVKVEIEAIAVS